MRICGTCGERSPDLARFCAACGASLEPAPPTPREVRKTVTVVFSDIVGSTSLGERLDPESLRRVMSRYFDEVRSVLEHHGGTVEKFIGDAVMAVFGIPVLHEDDAVRALRAAVRMHEMLVSLNQELERDYGVSLAVRTGVNTGQVVAGDRGAGQALVTGDAVNVAARLQQAAEPGQIVIGDSTRRLAGRAVEVEPTGPLVLAGKGDAVQAWRVVRIVPEAGDGRRTELRFVGRAPELEVLRQALARASETNELQLCTVVGPPGIGKSRIARELVSNSTEMARVVVGRCLAYGEGITYWPLAEIVREVAGSEPQDRIAEIVADDEKASLIAERIAGALGVVESGGQAAETAWAFRKLFEALARERPLIVVVDDIHWAQPTLLDLLEYLVSFSTDAPILLLCLARPELFDTRPSWTAPRPNARLLALQPLSDADSEALIERLVATDVMPGSAKARVVAAAEGNPLFVEQMIAMQTEEGRLGGQVDIPPSIQALLAARIDRLAPDERAVIERASVEGRSFHHAAVAELVPDRVRAHVTTHLMALVRKEFIRPDRTSLADDDAFRFGHILIRDAAYEAMPKGLRADLHERFAAWLERSAGERAREYEEILGYHLEQAHRYRTELSPSGGDVRIAIRASERLASAGRRAHARGDAPGAVNLLSRALALLPPRTPGRCQLLSDLGWDLFDTADFDGAERVVAEAIEEADATRDPGLDADARLLRLYLRLLTDPTTDHAQIRVDLERAIARLEATDDDLGLARAWELMCSVTNVACRSMETEQAAERAVVHARRAGARQEEARALVRLCSATSRGPLAVPDAIRKVEGILAGAQGSLRVEAAALGSLGTLNAMNGRIDEARGLVRRMRETYAELGLRLRSAASAMIVARVEMLAGDASAAESVLREGYDALAAIGETAFLSTMAWHLADALYVQGRYDEAMELTRTCQELAAPGDLDAQVGWRATRAKLLAAMEQPEEAEQLAAEAVALTTETDVPHLRGHALRAHADVLRRAGRAEAAAPLVTEAIRLYEAKGDLVSVAQTKATMAGVATA